MTLLHSQTRRHNDNHNSRTLQFYLFNYSSIQLWINEPRHDKTSIMSVRPAKTQISLGIRPVWSESSLCAQWVAKDPSFRHADSEDTDQTGRTPRLIWVFAGRTLILLVLSCRGSNKDDRQKYGSLLSRMNAQFQIFSVKSKRLMPKAETG